MQQALPRAPLVQGLLASLWHHGGVAVAEACQAASSSSSPALSRQVISALQPSVSQPLHAPARRMYAVLGHGAGVPVPSSTVHPAAHVRLFASCRGSHTAGCSIAAPESQLRRQQAGSLVPTLLRHQLRHMSSQGQQQKKPTSVSDVVMYGAAAAIAMIGAAWAAVPLYRAFCAATGYGGTVVTGTTVEDKLKRRRENPDVAVEKAATQREITVWFNADVADDMPWTFKPTQECVKVRPGQSTLAFFTAHNKSDQPITGYSVYNVAPDKAAQYFNKIQCFCFEEQRLRAGETVDMPVFFYLDPELVQDWNFRNIHDVTLSYVFHKVDDEDLEGYEEDDSAYGVKLHGPGLAPLPGGTAAAMLAGTAPGGQPLATVSPAAAQGSPVPTSSHASANNSSSPA